VDSREEVEFLNKIQVGFAQAAALWMFFSIGVLSDVNYADSEASNQKRVPAVFFRNAQVIINCIVSPKMLGFQSMKAEESARKSIFSYGRVFSLF